MRGLARQRPCARRDRWAHRRASPGSAAVGAKPLFDDGPLRSCYEAKVGHAADKERQEDHRESTVEATIGKQEACNT